MLPVVASACWRTTNNECFDSRPGQAVDVEGCEILFSKLGETQGNQRSSSPTARPRMAEWDGGAIYSDSHKGSPPLPRLGSGPRSSQHGSRASIACAGFRPELVSGMALVKSGVRQTLGYHDHILFAAAVIECRPLSTACRHQDRMPRSVRQPIVHSNRGGYGDSTLSGHDQNSWSNL